MTLQQLQARFDGLVASFSLEDLKNPVTLATFKTAIWNIKEEIKKNLYGRQ